MVSYRADFKANWRPLLGASLGMGSGMALSSFILSIFAPHLLKGLGWSKADFAMTGALSIFVLVSVPVVGRLTDLFGVRRVAAIGVAGTPLTFVGLSQLDHSLQHYMVLLVIQMTICATTTMTVYSRLIVQYFESSRGGALAICAAMPAVVGAIGSPLLSGYIAVHGWRQAYLAVAAYCFITGALALICIPPADLNQLARARTSSRDRAASGKQGDYRSVLTNGTFWLILASAFLVSLPQVLTNSQLALVLTEAGGNPGLAAQAVSIFAISVIVGRILAGLALDRFNPELVGAASLGLPGIGMFLLASPLDQPAILVASVALIGLAFGAEGDVLAYIVVRHFGVRIYGTVLGLAFAGIGTAASVGAIALSQSIRLTGSYSAFLVIGGCGVICGALLLLALSRNAQHRQPGD